MVITMLDKSRQLELIDITAYAKLIDNLDKPIDCYGLTDERVEVFNKKLNYLEDKQSIREVKWAFAESCMYMGMPVEEKLQELEENFIYLFLTEVLGITNIRTAIKQSIASAEASYDKRVANNQPDKLRNTYGDRYTNLRQATIYNRDNDGIVETQEVSAAKAAALMSKISNLTPDEPANKIPDKTANKKSQTSKSLMGMFKR